MRIVYSKNELQNAIKAGESRIIVKGQLADEIKKLNKNKKTRKKVGIVGGSLLTLGGLALAPFTFGASAIGVAAGATAIGGTALTIGTLTISTAELAILVGGGVAIIAMLKGYDKIVLNNDGSVTIYKKNDDSEVKEYNEEYIAAAEYKQIN